MDYSFLGLESKPVPKHETRKNGIVVSEVEEADTSRVCLDPVKTPGCVHADNISAESTKMVNKLLQQNHSEHHIFATREDERGVYIHNHIMHHDITIWALGAKPETLQSQHARNAEYQQGAPTIQKPLTKDLADDATFKRCVGKDEHFSNFVVFFEDQIREHGYQYVLQKYLVGGSDIANDMMCRIYMGYVHGIIHIGLALEFKQPALLAEGFAQAAVHHDTWYTEYLTGAEAEASEQAEAPAHLADLIDMCRADETIRTSSSIEYHRQYRPITGEPCMDKEMARDGVLAKAKPNIVRLAARWRVDPDDVERATAEVMNTAVYYTAGAQSPPHEIRYDFFLLHGVTASIGHCTFLAEPSMTNAQKARLLEYTGRVFLMSYAGMGCPEPLLDYVASHKSKLPNQGWAEVFARACLHEDDGHMAKMIRCMRQAQKISEPYDHLPEFRVKNDLFLKAAIAAIDSGSKKPMHWTYHFDFIRGAGFPEAWEKIPIRTY